MRNVWSRFHDFGQRPPLFYGGCKAALVNLGRFPSIRKRSQCELFFQRSVGRSVEQQVRRFNRLNLSQEKWSCGSPSTRSSPTSTVHSVGNILSWEGIFHLHQGSFQLEHPTNHSRVICILWPVWKQPCCKGKVDLQESRSRTELLLAEYVVTPFFDAELLQSPLVINQNKR